MIGYLVVRQDPKNFWGRASFFSPLHHIWIAAKNGSPTIPIPSQVLVISWPPVVQKQSGPEIKCLDSKLPKIIFTLV